MIIKSLKLILFCNFLGSIANAASPSDPGIAIFDGFSSSTFSDASSSTTPSGIEIGLRATVGRNVGLFGHLDYVRCGSEDTSSGTSTSLTTDDFRAAIGFGVPVEANTKVYIEAGYDSLNSKFSSLNTYKSDGTNDGYYVGIGSVGALSSRVTAYGSLGLLSLRTTSDPERKSGPEAVAGLALSFSPQTALFIEAKHTALSLSSTSFSSNSFRSGIKLNFQ